MKTTSDNPFSTIPLDDMAEFNEGLEEVFQSITKGIKDKPIEQKQVFCDFLLKTHDDIKNTL